MVGDCAAGSWFGRWKLLGSLRGRRAVFRSSNSDDADDLGVDRDTLRKLAAERSIPSEQDAPRCKLYFRRSDLDAWTRRRPSASPRTRGVGPVMSDKKSAPRRERVERNIYHRPTGAFEIGYKDASGKQRWRTVNAGITAARALRDQLVAQRGRGERAPDNNRLRFGDAADQWLEGPVIDLRPATRDCYRNAVNNHLHKRFDRQRFDATTRDDLAALVRDLRTEGLAEATIVIVLGVTNRIYRYASRYPRGRAALRRMALLATEASV